MSSCKSSSPPSNHLMPHRGPGCERRVEGSISSMSPCVLLCYFALDAAEALLHTDYCIAQRSNLPPDGRFLHHWPSCALLGRYGDPKPELQTQPQSRHLA